MSTAKRRINSTGRKKITQDKIDLRLLNTAPGDPVQAKLSLRLDDLALPDSAAVIVEAYHRSSAMQFDCGTVAVLQVPPILVLSELDQGAAALFRIKIIDQTGHAGKILASAERLRPRSDAEENGLKSIFPVRHSATLGQEIWQVEIDEDAGPVLLLNSTVPGLVLRIHENPLLSGAVLPPAFRAVLQRLATDTAEEEDGEGGGGWKSEWLKFCQTKLGMAEDPSELEDEEAREEWISEAVRKFSDGKSFVDRVKQVSVEHSHG